MMTRRTQGSVSNQHEGTSSDNVPTQHTVESRRSFLKSTMVAGAAIAGNAVVCNETSIAQDNSVPAAGSLKVKIAGYSYDRVEALIGGHVKIEGCDTEFEESRVGEMNTHVFSGPKNREVTEIGLLPFILAFANDEFRDYSLLPIFPFACLPTQEYLHSQRSRHLEAPGLARAKSRNSRILFDVSDVDSRNHATRIQRQARGY